MALILVIDDLEALRRVLQRMLESRRHRVLLAANGLEGLELWRERSPGLVMLDMDRPDRESIGALRQFRAVAPTLPIIAMSAGGPKGRFDMLGEARRLGATAALMKPFQLREVTNLIARVVGTAEARDGA
jgi:DNA-binding NtrC family response regulator